MATKSVISRALCCLTLSVVAECVSSSGHQECPGHCNCTENLLVHCDGHNSTALPVGLPNISSDLTLINYNLPELDLSELYNLTQLEGIVLSHNKIRHIKGTLDVFKHLSQVELKGNYLTDISPKLFGSITEQLKYVDLGGNPFNCDCGGIFLLNNDICDCTDNKFNCTCNIRWLQEQVKQNPNIWVGVYCHNSSKDTDIKYVVITDNLDVCRHKWRYIIGIIVLGVLTMELVVIAVLKLRCKKSMSSKTIRQGYVPINAPNEDDTIENERQADGDTDNWISSSTLPVAVSRQREPASSIQDAKRQPMAAPDVPASSNLPSQPRETMRPTEKELMELARNLTDVQWQSLAIDMGIKNADVVRIERDNSCNLRQQIFKMLLEWKSQNGPNATIGQLILGLETFRPVIDFEKYSFLQEEET